MLISSNLADTRYHETPPLAIFHALLIRLHNHVAKDLAKINPHWNHHKVFEVTFLKHISVTNSHNFILGEQKIVHCNLYTHYLQ